jgi:hypothetical protein
MERLVDGLLICAMLFGGLALAHPRTDVDLGHVRQIGGGLLVLFAMGLGALLWTARDPVLWGQRVGRLFARVWFGPHAVQVVRRFSGAMQGVLSHALPFLTWSVTYWAITVLQSWLVLRAAGVEVGAAEAATIVAIIGLSIQLPGGPAQAGVFQVGASVALALFLDETALAGPGSTFVALMYVLQLLGAVVMAVPGAALLWRRTRGKA